MYVYIAAPRFARSSSLLSNFPVIQEVPKDISRIEHVKYKITDAEHCCVCLERFRPLGVPSSLSLFPPAAVTQCIWSAWRSIAHKPMVRRTCYARCVATADARSAYMECGPF